MEKKKFSLCPDVDITEYEEKKSEQNKVTESNNSNHLTGIISPYVMNNFNFNEQYYTYNSYGTSSFLIPDQGLSIYNSINNSKKYREELKKTREKYNNPGTGDFNGPWAKYKDQTMFKNISNGTELTEEQKEKLNCKNISLKKVFSNFTRNIHLKKRVVTSEEKREIIFLNYDKHVTKKIKKRE